MADTNTEVHPGSFVGDSLEEFKKMPTWGKVAVGLVVLAVVGYVIYQKSHASSSTAPNITGTIPTGGGIPSGATPVYDPNGNIIGYSNPGSPLPPSPTPTPNPPPPTPAPPFTWPAALAGMKIWQGTVSHNFFYGPGGPQPHEKNQFLLSSLFPTGSIFSILPNGDLGYQLPGGNVIDSGVQMTNGNPPPPGGGSDNAPQNNVQQNSQIQNQVQQSQQSFQANVQGASPTSQPARLKLAAHVVQPGETTQTIAAKHGVSHAALVAANPTPISPGQKLIVPRGGK